MTTPYVAMVTAHVLCDLEGVSPLAIIAAAVEQDGLECGCPPAYAKEAGRLAAFTEKQDGDIAITVSALLQRFRGQPCERRRVLVEIAQLGL